jgi:hypothetical protein
LFGRAGRCWENARHSFLSSSSKSPADYFYLRKPEEEKLLGDPESYVKNEDKPCPITSDHVDGSRRIGQLEVTVKHNRHDEKLICCWSPMQGYSNAQAAARDRERE